MKKVGFIGWRGMVGSVLMNRMVEENDFANIDPVFFTTSQAGQKAPSFGGKDAGLLRDAYNIDLAKMTVHSFMEAVLSYFKNELFDMDEWRQMVEGLRRTVEGRDIIVPILEEIIAKRKK